MSQLDVCARRRIGGVFRVGVLASIGTFLHQYRGLASDWSVASAPGCARYFRNVPEYGFLQMICRDMQRAVVREDQRGPRPFGDVRRNSLISAVINRS